MGAVLVLVVLMEGRQPVEQQRMGMELLVVEEELVVVVLLPEAVRATDQVHLAAEHPSADRPGRRGGEHWGGPAGAVAA